MGRSIIRVLALDGDGIRGIIPARVLQEIEARIRKPIAQLFDVIAGTSTGGILALGLTQLKGKGESSPAFSAEELLGLYTEHGHEIFDRASWHMIGAAGGLLHERYSAGPLERLVKERFGDAMLPEALTEGVIPTYDLTLRGPFFFKRRLADPDTGKALDDACAALQRVVDDRNSAGALT